VKVLLVDDNDVDAEGVERAFRKHRILNPIIRARDGREALASLRSGAVIKPFIVLLDLNMPRMNGIEFLQELRADPTLHDSIVFVLTTSARDEDRAASYGFNVAGYVVKESVGEDFIKLLEMLGAYWRIVELPVEAH